MAVDDAKEVGSLPFNAKSAPLLMLHRTPLFMMISSGPSFTKPSGGGLAGPAEPVVAEGLPGAADGPPRDGLGKVILLAMPTHSLIPIASSSEDRPTS